MIRKDRRRFVRSACLVVALAAQPTLAADQEDVQQGGSAATQPAFYVRGDVGYAYHSIGAFGQAEVLGQGGAFVAEDFANAPYIGAGAGVRLSPWLRLDVTLDYRFSSDITATDFLQQTLSLPDGLMTASTTYAGEHTALVGLFNAYLDLPKWHTITPYVGAGIGFARNRFSDFTTESWGTFRDFGTGAVDRQTTTGVAGDKAKTGLAWALMAGFALDLDAHSKLDVGYRYVHLGSDVAATTGIIDCHCGQVGSPLTGSDLESHEVRIGVRWEFDSSGREPPAPLK